jgi:hypothetical protein
MVYTDGSGYKGYVGAAMVVPEIRGIEFALTALIRVQRDAQVVGSNQERDSNLRRQSSGTEIVSAPGHGFGAGIPKRVPGPADRMSRNRPQGHYSKDSWPRRHQRQGRGRSGREACGNKRCETKGQAGGRDWRRDILACFGGQAADSARFEGRVGEGMGARQGREACKAVD